MKRYITSFCSWGTQHFKREVRCEIRVQVIPDPEDGIGFISKIQIGSRCYGRYDPYESECWDGARWKINRWHASTLPPKTRKSDWFTHEDDRYRFVYIGEES